jgi:colanic acid/amylovoran biosynthesis glycosyltransferase
VEKFHLLDCTYEIGNSDNPFWRVLKIFPLFLTRFYKNPKVFLKSLNIAKYGREAKSLTLLYLASNVLGKQLKYDIIHCHFGQNGIKGVFLREIGIFQGKIITTFHGNDVHYYPRKYGKNVYKALFEKGDLYTINSRFTGNKAIELGCSNEKIIRHPVGLETSKFNFKKREINTDKLIKIITVARLVEKKGIEYSIKAVAQVLKKHTNLEYQIVGEGVLRPSIENLIAELGISNQVKLLGWKTHDELQKLYADSHIFILSSVTASDGDKEGQGLVLQEAQAMGLPVLSTLHNGIPDGVLDGKSGFLVPERDVEALAEKLNYLVEHPEVWSEMGLAGRKFVEQNYDINKLNDKLVQMYRDLLDINTRDTLPVAVSQL